MPSTIRPWSRADRFLKAVERLGNRLPDPVAIFVIMIGMLVAVSVLGAWLGWSSAHPVTGETLAVKSLLSEELVRQFFSEMPRTYTGFAPLGLVLVLILGAGVADHGGLFSALLRWAMRRVPDGVLIPVTILLGMLATHASDAGVLIYVPLAGLLFANTGRHPVLGMILAYVGAATGLVGNIIPGLFDVNIFGITETGAQMLVPTWKMNPLGNWWFQLAIAFSNIGLGWFIGAKFVEPRLPAWQGHGLGEDAACGQLSAGERRGLRRAGLVLLLLVGATVGLMAWPGYAPLYDYSAEAGQQLRPFFGSLVALLFMLFLLTGWAYGHAVGTISSFSDIVAMMAKGLAPLLPYLVLIFFASHFVVMFGWSNLGPIAAINGAAQLREIGAQPVLLLPILLTASALLDFLIASAMAKWTALAPVVVPMLMMLGISPEMTTAAYRVGDTLTNLISPLNSGFVLLLIFCQRWIPEMRLGTLLAANLPFAIAFYIAGLVITAGWVALELPLGPGTGVPYALPAR